MPTVLEPPKVWTLADLQGLPEDVDPRCYEIVDGALVVSPAASARHEYVSALLRKAIDGMLPDDLLTVGPVGVALGASYRIPDLLVAPRSALARTAGPLAQAQVLLAVEIVSPGSITTDRVTKPAQYAAAGIAGYWRVETDPQVCLSAYALAETGAYRELGTWGPGRSAVIGEPFVARIDLDALQPVR